MSSILRSFAQDSNQRFWSQLWVNFLYDILQPIWKWSGDMLFKKVDIYLNEVTYQYLALCVYQLKETGRKRIQELMYLLYLFISTNEGRIVYSREYWMIHRKLDFLFRTIRLQAHPLPPCLPSAIVSFSVFLCVAGRAYWRKRGVGKEPKISYDCGKAWPSVNHAILSGLPVNHRLHNPPLL